MSNIDSAHGHDHSQAGDKNDGPIATVWYLSTIVFVLVFQPIAAIYFAVNFTFAQDEITWPFISDNFESFRVACLVVAISSIIFVVMRFNLWVDGIRARWHHIAVGFFFLFNILACLPAAVLFLTIQMHDFPFGAECPARMRDITLFVADNLAYGFASTLTHTFDLSFSQCAYRTTTVINSIAYSIRTVASLGLGWVALAFANAALRHYKRQRAAAQNAATPPNRDLEIPVLP